MKLRIYTLSILFFPFFFLFLQFPSCSLLPLARFLLSYVNKHKQRYFFAWLVKTSRDATDCNETTADSSKESSLCVEGFDFLDEKERNPCFLSAHLE